MALSSQHVIHKGVCTSSLQQCTSYRPMSPLKGWKYNMLPPDQSENSLASWDKRFLAIGSFSATWTNRRNICSCSVWDVWSGMFSSLWHDWCELLDWLNKQNHPLSVSLLDGLDIHIRKDIQSNIDLAINACPFCTSTNTHTFKNLLVSYCVS